MEVNSQTIDEIFFAQKEQLPALAKQSTKHRKSKLKRLLRSVRSNEKRITDALHLDMRKHEVESKVSELLPIYSEFNHTIQHLNQWTKKKTVPTPIIIMGGKSFIQPEPKGNVLIIAPWNYPFSLVMGPLISALAAGNTVMIKPSEFTPHINQVIKEIIEDIFPRNEVALIEGAVETAQHLLSLPFNHIFFTGSPAIGKIVMEAASKHLTSVTLELGGKSPVVVDRTANVLTAAKRLAWGKCMNNGQICLSPDYVLIDETKLKEFIQHFSGRVKKLYDDPSSSESYSRIINTRHFERIQELLNDQHGGQVHSFGDSNLDDLFIPPTLIINP